MLTLTLYEWFHLLKPAMFQIQYSHDTRGHIYSTNQWATALWKDSGMAQIFTHQTEIAETFSKTGPFLWDLRVKSGIETDFSAIRVHSPINALLLI